MFTEEQQALHVIYGDNICLIKIDMFSKLDIQLIEF